MTGTIRYFPFQQTSFDALSEETSGLLREACAVIAPSAVITSAVYYGSHHSALVLRGDSLFRITRFEVAGSPCYSYLSSKAANGRLELYRNALPKDFELEVLLQSGSLVLKEPFLKQGIGTSEQRSEAQVGQLLMEVKELHSRQLWHGDIHIDNLALSATGDCLLLFPFVSDLLSLKGSPDRHERQRSDLVALLRLLGSFYTGVLSPEAKGVLERAASNRDNFIALRENLLDELPTFFSGAVPSGKTIQPAKPQVLKAPARDMKVAPQAPDASTARSLGSKQRIIWMFSIFIFVIFLLFYEAGGKSLFEQRSNVTSAQWNSDDPEDLARVAEAALSGDDFALALIMDEPKAGVRSELLEFFSKAPDLSALDESLILEQALYPLTRSLSPSDEYLALSVFPKAFLAGAGMNLEANRSWIKRLHARDFLALPEPYVLPFRALNEGQFPRACIYLSLESLFVLGENQLTRNLSQCAKDNASVGVLISLFDALWMTDRKRAESFVSSLESLRLDLVGEIMQWFDSAPVISWSARDSNEKLAIGLLARLPDDLSLVHKLDLLSFPLEKVRSASLEALLGEQLPATEEALLRVLAKDLGSLPRVGSLSLLLGIAGPEENRSALFSRYLENEPDLLVMKKLLLATTDVEGENFFSLSLLRALRERDWTPSLNEAATLISHGEKTVRAYIYSFLSASVPEERTLLEQAREREGDNRLLGLLNDKFRLATD
jgi:hypothetical protein